MIIKQADDRTHDIQTLQHIIQLPYISRDQLNRAKRELIALRSGLKGEREAAYHINFHYGKGENYAIIHDLRLEHEGRVAQIDHLIIGRMLHSFLCETKYWSDGITINSQGEFSAQYGSKKIGVPSPVMQNKRHIKVLSDILASERVERPKRLGVRLPVSFYPITLVSTGAKIERPNEQYGDVIKADQLNDYIQSQMDRETSVLSLGKLVTANTLRDFAEAILAMHTPNRKNYWTMLGIEQAKASSLRNSSGAEQVNQVQNSPNTSSSNKKIKIPKQYVCAVCTKVVELKVARFCWFNKKRFDNEIRCRSHQ